MLMQNELVGLGRRLLALTIDVTMLFLAHIPLSLIIREMTVSPTVILLLDYAIIIIYSTVFISGRGQTPGKIMFLLRVISAKGGAITQRQAAIRAVVKWTPMFVVFIALAVMSPPQADPQTYLQPDAGAIQNPEAAMPATVVTLVGMAIALVLIILARIHPDRQAPHDRIAGTYLIRLQ